MFFNERVAASEKILTTASEKKNVQLLLRNYVDLRNILNWKQRKIKNNVWLNYCDENHIERIPIAVENINHLFHLASQIIEADRLHLYLLSDGTRIDDNEYLESLENSAELIACTEEQIKKLSVYFELKRYLSLKNMSYHWLFYMTLGCFLGGCFFKNNFNVKSKQF